MTQDKAFEIPKTLIWKSYLEVRKNRGAAGCDGQTIKQFDENLQGIAKRRQVIWNLCIDLLLGQDEVTRTNRGR